MFFFRFPPVLIKHRKFLIENKQFRGYNQPSLCLYKWVMSSLWSLPMLLVRMSPPTVSVNTLRTFQVPSLCFCQCTSSALTSANTNLQSYGRYTLPSLMAARGAGPSWKIPGQIKFQLVIWYDYYTEKFCIFFVRILKKVSLITNPNLLCWISENATLFMLPQLET